MAKQGMARPEWTHPQPHNEVPPVPEIGGKAKHTKEHARPVIAGEDYDPLRVYHALKGDGLAGSTQPK